MMMMMAKKAHIGRMITAAVSFYCILWTLGIICSIDHGSIGILAFQKNIGVRRHRPVSASDSTLFSAPSSRDRRDSNSNFQRTPSRNNDDNRWSSSNRPSHQSKRRSNRRSPSSYGGVGGGGGDARSGRSYDDDDNDVRGYNRNYNNNKNENDDVVITDTNAHFFSKKSLNDPSFQLLSLDEDEDDENNSKKMSSSSESMVLHKRLCEGAGITRPSRIQSLAWPPILEGKHVIVGEQTGSGKTLGYLLPSLQRVLLEKQREKQSPSNNSSKTKGAPRLLILAPTAELADQIRDVCTSISQSVPFNTMVITASGKQTTSIRDQIRMIQRQPIDVLISTPGRIATILRTKNSGLDLTTNLQAIVLDEVDILMIDETFGPQLRTVGAAAPPLEKTQFVFVTATLPDSIVDTVQKEFPGVVQVRGPGLHRLAPSLKEHLVDVSVPSSQNRNEDICFDVKAQALLSALRQNRCRRTLVFCNTVESCRQVENLLNRKDRRGKVLEVLAYHNAMAPEARNTNLEVFANGRRTNHFDDDFRDEFGSSTRRRTKRDSKSGDDDSGDIDYVLVCTDRAARGVDFDASPVDHIVIFDFPKDPAEYIRRVGRTARAGRTGTSTVLAYGWQLPIARQVMGSKLDSFSIATTQNVKDNDDEYDFRKKKARRNSRKNEEIAMKIQSGELWE